MLFLGLVAQLTYLQVVDSNQLANDPRNVRKFLRDISAAARRDRHRRRRRCSPSRCRATTSSSTSACTRRHGAAVRARHRLPVDPVRIGRRRERVLVASSRAANLASLRTSCPGARQRPERPGTVVLTLTAEGPAGGGRPGSRGRRGSVVVLDVQTGGVVAMYSNPTFDPHAARVARRRRTRKLARQFLLALPDNPLLARAWRELYPPGSTFKTVTASTALARQRRRQQALPVRHRAPAAADDRTLQNFGGETLRRHARRELHRCRATRRSARSASTSASSSRRASSASASTPTRRHPTSTRRSCRSIGPQARLVQAQPAAVRAGRDRAGRRRGHAARDGARRRVGRDRRRDPRAARRRPHRGLRRQRRAAVPARRSGGGRWTPRPRRR